MAGNILLKGYSASAANILTTELNSLADGNVCAVSSAIDNTTALDEFIDFELNLASLTISSTSAYVSVFIVPSLDGTNYPDAPSSAVAFANYMGQYLAGTILVKNVSATTARAELSQIPIGPGKFKVFVRNGTGASLASSGNTLSYRTYANSYT